MGVGNWCSCREARGERNGKMIRINQIKLTPDKGKEEFISFLNAAAYKRVKG